MGPTLETWSTLPTSWRLVVEVTSNWWLVIKVMSSEKSAISQTYKLTMSSNLNLAMARRVLNCVKNTEYMVLAPPLVTGMMAQMILARLATYPQAGVTAKLDMFGRRIEIEIKMNIIYWEILCKIYANKRDYEIAMVWDPNRDLK